MTIAFAQQKMDIKMCCLESRMADDLVFEFFPEDGGKPYGISIGIVMSFVDQYNQNYDPDISIDYVKGTIEECLLKMRNGEVDLMMNLDMNKDDRREYMWSNDIDRYGKYNLVLSRKGRLINYSSNIGTPLFYIKDKIDIIENTDWENMGQSFDEIEIAYNCVKKEQEEDLLDLTSLVDESSDDEECEKRKLSEIVAYIDKEFIFSLYMNQMSEIVKSSDWLGRESRDGGDNAEYYNTFGPIFFNISSPINSVMLNEDQQMMNNIGGAMEDYWAHSKELEQNIVYCLDNPSSCIYFNEAVVTYLVMKNSYGIDFTKNYSPCSGERPIVVYSKDKPSGPFADEMKPYQRILFKGSCFDSYPPHHFIGEQGEGFESTPFKGFNKPYNDLITSLANYHYSTVWEKDYPDPKSILGEVKAATNESKKIFEDEKEWKSVTSFVSAYGELMKNSIQSRKQRVEEMISQEKQKEDKKIADLRNKVRTPENVFEALIYFDGENGMHAVYMTPYDPDGKVYGITGTVEGKIGKYYRINTAGISGERFFLLNTSSTLNEGQLIGVVGKFNEVMMLSTLFSDVAKPYAVLSDLQYLNGKLLN